MSEVGIFIIPILEIKKMKHEDTKYLVQVYIASNW